MEEVKIPKTVKQVFKDYNSSSFELNDAKVIGINLYKKKNVLEILIESDNIINITDILELEKYIEKRFQVKEAKINIKYNLNNTNNIINFTNEQNKNQNNLQEDISNKIINEWTSIVNYISHKHPIAKAFLKDSIINIEKNHIQVTLNLNGKEFLENNKFSEVFSSIIENVYGKKYTITYTEKISENSISKYKENQRKLEKETILELTQNNLESTPKQNKAVVRDNKNTNILEYITKLNIYLKGGGKWLEPTDLKFGDSGTISILCQLLEVVSETNAGKCKYDFNK